MKTLHLLFNYYTNTVGIIIALLFAANVFGADTTATNVAISNQEKALIQSAFKAYDAKNYSVAFPLFEKAAVDDSTGLPQALIGDMYLWGEGVDRNYRAAIYWDGVALNKIHEANNLSVLSLLSPLKIISNMGIAYEKLHDYVKAFQSYQTAAKLGNATGQYNIARCFTIGRGTIQDYEKAYAWMSVAIAQGFKNAERRVAAKKLQGALYNVLSQRDVRAHYYGGQSDSLARAQALAKKYYKLYVLHETVAPKKQTTIGNRIDSMLASYAPQNKSSK